MTVPEDPFEVTYILLVSRNLQIFTSTGCKVAPYDSFINIEATEVYRIQYLQMKQR